MATIIFRILGNFTLVLLILVVSCDRIHYLTLRSNDGKLTKLSIENREFLTYLSDSLEIKMTSSMLGMPPSKQKKGAKVWLTLYLKGQNDIRFDALKTYLVGNNGQKFYPEQPESIDVHKYKIYSKSITHEIELEFLHPSGIFQLPLELYLPPISFRNSENELKFDKIIIE